MKKGRWMFALIAAFAVTASLGIWLVGTMLNKPSIGKLPLKPTAESVGSPSESVADNPFISSAEVSSAASVESSAAPVKSSAASVRSSAASVESSAAPVKSSAASVRSSAASVGSSAASVESSAAPVEDSSTAPGFHLSAESVDPGEFLVITAYGLESADPITVESPFGGSPKFFAVKDHFAALLPIKNDCAPSTYSLRVTGGGYDAPFHIRVMDKQFAVQHIEADESTLGETVESVAANDEYMKKVHPLKSRSADHPLWDGAFLQPVQGNVRITGEFGLIRTINGKPSEDRHGGLDLACAQGTAVVAANSGTILFAEFIALTGNTVLIDHGMGLKTAYYHMSALNVKAGDTVTKGQRIGAVGTTGFSTGPHLHFAALVQTVYVNPRTLMMAAPAV